MKTIPFNDGWQVRRADAPGAFAPVTLPHDAMITEPVSADSRGGTNTGWVDAHDYEYLKEFTVPAEWEKEQVILEFEGIYHRAGLYVNGERLYAHPNGYFGFRQILNPYLRFGETNSIRVVAQNSDQPNSRWYSGTGIYRPVWVHLLPERHILPQSIRVDTLDPGTRRVRISFETSCPGEVTVRVLGREKRGVSHVEFDLPEAELWSPSNPRLYTAVLRFAEDEQEVRFGIRTVSVSAKDGFCLNGERVLLLGACVHHDNGMLGAAAHPFAERRKIALLKKAGYNAIRSAHNPAGKALLDACDELGVLVLDEYADMWYMHKTAHDYAAYFEKNWQDDLRLLVEKDYNHPSVIMYSIGNEVAETAGPKGVTLARQMRDYLHGLDSRPVTCGINLFFNYLSSLGLGVYSDEKAKREEKAAGGGKRKKAVGSEFINSVAGFFGAGFMKFGATLPGSDRRTRDAYACLDAAGYNYGINRYKTDLRRYPDRVILGSETFVSDAAAFYDIAKKHPAVIGDFVWTGMDYLGEVGLGAWEYESEAPDFAHGPGWRTAGAGTIDLIGQETCQMAYTRTAFGLDPVRIGVVPVTHIGKKHSPGAWRFTNAVESWSWEGCEGRRARVEVYGRGAHAELRLNGKSIGKKPIPASCRTSFTAVYAPGLLEAVVYDSAGGVLGTARLKSAEGKTALRLHPERDSVAADGLWYVLLEYSGEDGTLRPSVKGKIRVSVQGGRLLALGNACPYQPGGYRGEETDTYYGKALAVIAPEGEGRMRLTAESGYGTATAECAVCEAQ